MGLLDGAAIGAGADAFMRSYGLASGVQDRRERQEQNEAYRQQLMQMQQQAQQRQQQEQQRQQQAEDRTRQANALLLGGGLLGDAGPNGRTPGEMSTKYGGYNPLEYVNPNTVAAMQPEPVKWEAMSVGDSVVAYNPYTQETKRLGASPQKHQPRNVQLVELDGPQGYGKYAYDVDSGRSSFVGAMPAPKGQGTPGENALDKEAAKELAAFGPLGGYADVAKNLQQLEDVTKRLESGENLTGPVIGNTPDILLRAFNPEALDARDSVEEVVQRNLRLILGAQFTEREGTRLIERAYNPSLDEEVNIVRLKRLMDSIRRAAESKRQAYEYLQKNGTLRGFSGKIYSTIDDIAADAGINEGAAGSLGASGPSAPQVMRFDTNGNPVE